MKYFSFNSAVKKWQPATVAETSAVEVGYVAGVTSPIQSQLDSKAPIASPTFTGTVALPESGNGLAPVGMLAPFAGAAAPTGWLLCAGQTVPRLGTYAKLFAVISTTYNTGGEAGTDFRLPDLRGRTVAGPDNMGGTDAGRLDIANASGTVTGAQYVSTSNHAHLHVSPIGLNSGTSMVINPAEPQLDLFGSYNIYDIQTGSGHYSGSGTVAYERYYVTSSSSGAESLNKMQPTMILNYIIKI